MRCKGQRLPRFERNREAVRRIELNARDREIIRQVARFRLLRSTQILQLVAGGRAQIVRRLQVLYHHGWLDRPRCQIDYYYRRGSRPMVYCLGSRGASLMRREYDLPFGKMLWMTPTKDTGRLFLEHTLMAAEITITIEKACRDGGGGIRFLSAEELIFNSRLKDAFRWNATIGTRRVGLVPDVVFGLECPSAPPETRRVVCCLEADRGTMPVSRKASHLSSIGRKLAAYASVWKAGAFAKRFGTKRVAVLTVTLSADRAAKMREESAKLTHGQGLFSFWTLDEVTSLADALLNQWKPDDGGRN